MNSEITRFCYSDDYQTGIDQCLGLVRFIFLQNEQQQKDEARCLLRSILLELGQSGNARRDLLRACSSSFNIDAVAAGHLPSDEEVREIVDNISEPSMAVQWAVVNNLSFVQASLKQVEEAGENWRILDCDQRFLSMGLVPLTFVGRTHVGEPALVEAPVLEIDFPIEGEVCPCEDDTLVHLQQEIIDRNPTNSKLRDALAELLKSNPSYALVGGDTDDKVCDVLDKFPCGLEDEQNMVKQMKEAYCSKTIRRLGIIDPSPLTHRLLIEYVDMVKSCHSVKLCFPCEWFKRRVYRELLARKALYDVPIRDQEWFRANKCEVVPHTFNCPEFTLPDAYFLWREGHCPGAQSSSGFRENARVVMRSCSVSLNFAQGMARRSKKEIVQNIRSNPYVILCTRTNDSYIMGLEGNEQFFQDLYKVRKVCGVNGTFGFEGLVPEFEAQGEDSDFFEVIKKLVSSFAKGFVGSVTTVADAIASAVSSVFSYFLRLVGMVSDLLRRVMERLQTTIVSWLVSLVIPEEFLAEGYVKEYMRKFLIGAILVCVVFFAASSLISFGLVTLMLRFVSSRESFFEERIPTLEEDVNGLNYDGDLGLESRFREAVLGKGLVFEAQGEDSLTKLLSVLLVGVLGLTMASAEDVRKRCLQLTAIMAGGTAVASMAQLLFAVLPYTLRLALAHKFASTEYLLKIEFDEWRSKTGALLLTSKIPNVVSSEMFKERVFESLTEATSLIDRAKDHSLRAQILVTYNKLMATASMLTQMQYSPDSRIVPFAIHLSGPPGIGKSTLVPTMLRKAFNKRNEEVFFRTNSDEFFSGFLNQKAIVYDEFLLSAEREEAIANEYLSLVSGIPFQPPVASVDNPAVGIKGVTASPDVVVSMNNTPYNIPVGVPKEAFQRRRQCVVEIAKSDRWKSQEKSTANANMRSYTPTEISKAVWVKFRLLPGAKNDLVSYDNHPWVDFETVCQQLKAMYDEHRAVSEIVVKAMGAGASEERSPQEILNEMTAKAYGVPTKPKSLTQVLGDFFIGNQMFVAQGPGEHKHQCCTQAPVHAKPTGLFKCKSCGKTTSCTWMSQEAEVKVRRVSASAHEDEDYQSADDEVDRPLNPHEYSEFLVANASNVVSMRIPGIPHLKELCVSMSRTSAYIGVFVGCAGALIAAYVRSLLNNNPVERVTFMAQSARPQRYTRRTHQNRLKKGLGLHSQGAMKALEEDVCELIIDGVKTVRVIPVGGLTFLTYGHAFYMDGKPIPHKTSWRLRIRNKEYEGHFNQEEVMEDPDNDIVFFNFDSKKLAPFKFMHNRFVDADAVGEMNDVSVKLHSSGKLTYSVATKASNKSYTQDSQRIELAVSWMYRAATTKGDCGSPLVVSSGPFAGKLIGIHVAGTGVTASKSYGLATILTKQLVASALRGLCIQWMERFPEKLKEENDLYLDYEAEGPNAEHLSEPEEIVERLELLPNVIRAEVIAVHEEVHLTRKSKLKPSLLAGKLSRPAKKQLPILSKRDPRAKGSDPVVNSILDTATTEHCDVDEEMVDALAETVTENYIVKLEWPVGKRELSFEEACAGVPGKLTSIKVSSSPGYPLIYERTKKGKTDFVWFDEKGELNYTPRFKELVLRKVKEMKSWNGEKIDHVFLGYLKDEMISEAKVKEVRVRMIYANDLVCLVAFRMLFGAILAAFNQSDQVPSAIGINQYSYDMERVYNYLSEVGKDFIDGDYKSFDKRMQRYFRRKAYEVIKRLFALYSEDMVAFEWMVKHETESPAQVGNIRMWTVSNHFSGCFWTTPLNCIVNELYMRYCFRRFQPTLAYDEHVRGKFLGDDHILCVSKECGFTPATLGVLMKEIGQEYTAAEKGAELTDDLKSFGEVMFLGAIPRLVNGRWSGAMKKDTLFETVQHTRDNNLSLGQTCNQMVECASQWDREFFNAYRLELKKALPKEKTEGWQWTCSWGEMRDIVANRTSEAGFAFVAQGPAEDSNIKPENALTMLSSINEAISMEKTETGFPALASEALNDAQGNLFIGTNSLMLRKTLDWTTSGNPGEVLYAFDFPADILALENANNLQNMPFQRFIYTTFDGELMFKITANPFSQGLLCVYFIPLYKKPATTALNDFPTISAARSFEHVLLSPNKNTSATLKIPFRFPRSAMNTFAIGMGEESLGTVVVQVISNLVNPGSTIPISIQMFSRFPNAKFTLPRPIVSSTKVDRVNATRYAEHRTRDGRPFRDDSIVSISDDDIEFEAQGGSVSKTENTYNISSVAGNVPIQTNATSAATTKVETQAEVPLPMDKPPAAGGGVPTYHQIQSLSQSNGTESLNAMQLHPQMMHRQHMMAFNHEESRLETMMGKPGLLTQFVFTTNQAEGDPLVTFPLDSLFGYGVNDVVPPNVALLNEFLFWRADIELTFMAVKNDFQSARALLTVAYGAPSVASTERNIYRNAELDFSPGAELKTVIIDYNAATSFLRTVEAAGGGGMNPIQDFGLGLARVSVMTRLQVNSTNAAPEFAVLVFVSFRNVRLYELRPFPIIQYQDYDFGHSSSDITVAVPPPASRGRGSDSDEFEAQGPGEGGSGEMTNTQENMTSNDESAIDQPTTDTAIHITQTETQVQPVRVCRLNLGHKFEYVIDDVHEAARRYVGVPFRPFTANEYTPDLYAETPVIFNAKPDYTPDTGTVKTAQSLGIPVRPVSRFRFYFAAWAGHLNYIYVSNLNQTDRPEMYFVPINNLSYLKSTFSTDGPVYAGNAMLPGNQIKPTGLTAIVRTARSIMTPLELAGADSSGNYSRVSVPFSTPLNFLLTSSFESVFAPAVGYLYYREYNNVGPHTTVRQAAGDDFKFGIYRPPFRSIVKTVLNESGADLSNRWFGLAVPNNP